MKRFCLTLGVIGMGLLAAPQLPAITLSFANISGASVEFVGTGDTFHFNSAVAGPQAGNQFAITASDGIGDSVGDLGVISGSFTIGAITVHPGNLQTAHVTGSGTIKIKDGINDLVASVFWDQIQTSGTAGSLNLTGLLNLGSITYGGSQTDLKHLAYPGAGTAVLSFTFIPSRSLQQLTTNGSDRKTSFNGTFSAVPDGGITVVLLGVGLIGLATFSRSTKRSSKA